MTYPKLPATKRLPWIGLAALVLLAGCSVNVKKNAAGDEKKVDIETPVGGIHVDDSASARDTGLAVYPGAREVERQKGDDHGNANVNISGFGFGIKVVAIEYESSDSPEKLIQYYKDQMGRYGKVLECHGEYHGGDVKVDHAGGSEELSCDRDNGGKSVELKAGTRGNQHVVAIEPKDGGSKFALVYVRTHGKDDTI